MNAWMNPLASWLLDYAVLATLLLAAALIGRLLLRRPAERMAVAWSCWLGLAALAILTALPAWPRISLNFHEVKPSVASQEVSDLSLVLPPVADEIAVLPFDGGAFVEPAPEPVVVHRAEDPKAFNWPTVAISAWLAVACLSGLWISLGLLQTRRLVLTAQAAPTWIHRELARVVGKRRHTPELALSQRISTAAALSALRPKILLPAAAGDATCAPAVQAALSHEWAHIRHGDLWLLALERLLLPLLAWHPLFWLARRGVRMDQELLADAAAAGDRPLEYAEALVAWAQSANAPPLGLAGLSLWESPHTLSRRIAMLVDPSRSPPVGVNRFWQLAAAAVILTMTCGLSLFSLAPLTADEPSGTEPIAVQQPAESPAAVPPQSRTTGEQQVKVFTLRSGDAPSRADLLRSVLGDGSSPTRQLRLSADPRTNSIVATGSAEDLETIRGLLERLDASVSPTVPEAGAVVPPLPPRAATAPVAPTPVIPALPAPAPAPVVATIPAIAARSNQEIVISATVLAINSDELLKVLPEVEKGAQPSPTLSVLLPSRQEWKSKLERLKEASSAKVIAQPRLVALDKQSMTIAIASEDAASSDKEPKPVMLSLGVTPELQRFLRTTDNKEELAYGMKLRVDFKQATIAEPSEPVSGDSPQATDEKPIRNFSTTVTLQSEKIAVLADRSVSGMALVVAIDPIVSSFRPSAPPQPVRHPHGPTTTQAVPVARPPAAPFPPGVTLPPGESHADVRKELLRLRREIDQLLGENAPPSQGALQPAAGPAANVPYPIPSAIPRRTPAGTVEALADLAPRDNSGITARRAEHQKTIKLMELDLKDAELEIEAAKAMVEDLTHQAQKGTGSQADLARARVELRRAEIRLEKLRVLLEAEREKGADLPPNVAPATPREPPVRRAR